MSFVQGLMVPLSHTQMSWATCSYPHTLSTTASPSPVKGLSAAHTRTQALKAQILAALTNALVMPQQHEESVRKAILRENHYHGLHAALGLSARYIATTPGNTAISVGL